jgi:hypothetical protein
MSGIAFVHLNPDWNAEPNAPEPAVAVAGDTLELSFRLNSFAYQARPGEIGRLRFRRCSRWRRDDTNDEAWFAGRGRFAGEAPAWGEFYEILGEDPSGDSLRWHVLSAGGEGDRHFLFYLRDETFECLAADWTFERRPAGSP